jgi:hypothetical protein
MVFDTFERGNEERGIMMTSKKLYDDKELFEEIRGSIQEIGGEIEIIDRFHNLFKIIIAPELQEHANLIIQDTINMFASKRARQIERDPFTGVKIFVKDIQG